MKKKTIEELRAANRVRQARWRVKHKWLAKERRLAVYGKSRADKEREGEERAKVIQETYRSDIEGVDVAYKGERRGIECEL